MRESFDAATARAVAPLNVLCELLLPLVRRGREAVALKGPGAAAEARRRKTLWKRWAGSFSPSRKSPSPARLGAHAGCAGKTAPTPEKYPRRVGVPEKRPL